MTAFKYEDADGAVIEVTSRPDGSLTVTVQGADGPIVCVSVPAGERARLAAAARPPMVLGDQDDWLPLDVETARSVAWQAGGPGDG